LLCRCRPTNRKIFIVILPEVTAALRIVLPTAKSGGKKNMFSAWAKYYSNHISHGLVFQLN
jgi:hypothetical protein